MESRGVLVAYIRVIHDMYDGPKIRVRIVGDDSKPFLVDIELY